MDTVIPLIQVLTELLKTVIWPGLVLLMILLFHTPLHDFITGLGEFSFKAGASGLEASAKKYQAAASLGAAVGAQSKEEGARAVDTSLPTQVANTIHAISDRDVLKLAGKRVLWVDDRPGNNVYERRALEALGIQITTSTSTEDARDKLQSGRFEVVISDFSRPGDPQAGYTLLGVHQQMGLTAPYIIYAGSTTPQYRQEAQQRGVFGQTNNPQELFQLVLNALLVTG